jgi:hypothetical protein
LARVARSHHRAVVRGREKAERLDRIDKDGIIANPVLFLQNYWK